MPVIDVRRSRAAYVFLGPELYEELALFDSVAGRKGDGPGWSMAVKARGPQPLEDQTE